jgi:hypothetical protein
MRMKYERDGTIRPYDIVRARWSVTLRSNSRNLEDRQGYTGTSLGLLWGGECAKVIDSRLDGRLQTWAFVEIVPCPLSLPRIISGCNGGAAQTRLG